MNMNLPSERSHVDKRLELLDAEIDCLGNALVAYALRPSAYDAIWSAYEKRHEEYMKLFTYKVNNST